MTLFFSFMLTLFLTCSAQAQNLKTYVMSQDAKLDAYKAQLEVEPQSRSYVDSWTKEHPIWSKVQKLQQTFETAQKSYLTEDLQTALKKFEDVVKLRFEEDWDEAQLKMIFYSLLRLAEHNYLERDWLKESYNFNSSLQPDADVFAPPFVERWQDGKQFVKLQTWDLSGFIFEEELLIINGEKISRAPFITRADTVYRFTLISNRYLPLTVQGTWLSFQDKLKQRIPFAKGNCLDPQWQTAQSGLKVFFSSECQLASRENKKRDLQLMPEVTAPIFAQQAPLPKQKKFWQSQWFWFGVAAVSGAVAYNQLKPKRETQATSREGF